MTDPTSPAIRTDLNADCGESFGAYSIGQDAALMPLITSANIACGFHGGDPDVMDATVKLALAHNVTPGAHPGYPDLVGFGRRELKATPIEIENFVLYQIGALSAFAKANHSRLAHVKPHGALYNTAAKDIEIARAIGRAILRFDPSLVYVGLANSAMIQAARELGLPFAREGFCDRAYEADGSLRSRRLAGAVHSDPAQAAAQALKLAREHSVTTFTGEIITLEVDTLCIHGDNPNAVEIARAVRETLVRHGIQIAALEPKT
jgi:UPF0271 protein